MISSLESQIAHRLRYLRHFFINPAVVSVGEFHGANLGDLWMGNALQASFSEIYGVKFR
jgi:hypothetical protein